MLQIRLTPWLVIAALTQSCATSRSPWDATAPRLSAAHAQVQTRNPDYDRLHAKVLVREVNAATRANLDYAAYHANFMIADPEPEVLPDWGQSPDTQTPFSGALEKQSLTADLRATGLSPSEQQTPLAFVPLVEHLLSNKVAGAEELDQVRSRVRQEWWGYPAIAGAAPQSISELYVHDAGGGAKELWAKVEFAPWFRGLGQLSDQDADGVAEIYGRLPSTHVTTTVLAALSGDYVTRALTEAEVRKWGNELASYWYPSYNTDLVPAPAAWPDVNTEQAIRKQVGSRSYVAPTLVMRGKPEGEATYQLFIVKGTARCEQCEAAKASQQATPLNLERTEVSPDTSAVMSSIEAELAAHGKSWTAWAEQLRPFSRAAQQQLRKAPEQKAYAGVDGFLFFRNCLQFAQSGDLLQQRKGKNPLPAIVEFKQELAKHGVDFLFVPVPTKLEVFPEKWDPKSGGLSGKVVNPYARKFLLDLSRAGVEVVDLLSVFLAARNAETGREAEALYQHQDTHWTSRGLQIAADVLAQRIKKYPWYPQLGQHAKAYTTQEASFTRFGDLHSRLPEALQKNYTPETLPALRVLENNAAYQDEASSPLVLLGDSYTGVYELTDVESAGVSAHLARGVSFPIDLLTSYGGGPNVRNKLMRRGAADLDNKKLVIWMMTARDLYDYWEDWEALKGPSGP